MLRERGEARARVAEERVRFHPVPGDRQQRRGRSDARERADDAVEQLLRFCGGNLAGVPPQQHGLELREAQREELHRGLEADLPQRRGHFLDHIDVLPPRRGALEQLDLARGVVVRAALHAVQ